MKKPYYVGFNLSGNTAKAYDVFMLALRKGSLCSAFTIVYNSLFFNAVFLMPLPGLSGLCAYGL